MTIETELVALVVFYSGLDKETNRYTTQLGKDDLLRLDANFVKWVNHQLLSDGAKKYQLERNYRKLSNYFHSDKAAKYSPEITWLENQLSAGKNDGTCFKTLTFCYEKLTQPTKFKEIEFSGINSIDDCKKWLETLKSKSSTYSSRTLCDSLIDLLDQSNSFFDATGAIKPKGLKALVSFIPVLIASFSTVIVVEELFAIFALYFVVLKGGQKLSKSDYRELKQIGETMQEYSTITALTTTTLLVRVLEMIFWASRHCLTMSLSIGSSILAPLLTSTPTAKANESDTAAEVCRDLALAGKNATPGRKFSTPELKVIAAPFEKYLGLNAQQFFANWRVGGEKRLMVEAFLFHLEVFDRLPISLDVKLNEVQKELNKLRNNEEVYTKKTAEAVDYAQNVIDILQSPSSTELLEYDKPSGQELNTY